MMQEIMDQEERVMLDQIAKLTEETEEDEYVVVYQALYGNFEIYARPYKMFMSEVDHEKYPEIKQKYRFELWMENK